MSQTPKLMKQSDLSESSSVSKKIYALRFDLTLFSKETTI